MPSDTPGFSAPSFSPSPHALPDTLRQQLAPGEPLLWHGRPRQGLMLRPSDAFLIPFSLLWGGFAIVWEWQALRMGAGTFFALGGIPFVLLGLYIMVGRFWVDAGRRARTHYAVTDERVLFAHSGHIQALALRQLPAASLSLRASGRGSIHFGTTDSRLVHAAILLPPGWPGLQANVLQFDEIDDAQRVFALIRDAQRRAVGVQ